MFIICHVDSGPKVSGVISLDTLISFSSSGQPSHREIRIAIITYTIKINIRLVRICHVGTIIYIIRYTILIGISWFNFKWSSNGSRPIKICAIDKSSYITCSNSNDKNCCSRDYCNLRIITNITNCPISAWIRRSNFKIFVINKFFWDKEVW